MRVWPSLYFPPLAFLILQSLNYALEPWACENQQRLPMHVSAAVCLVIALACAALAWRGWETVGGSMPDEEATPEARTRFFAVVGLMVSALSALAILALWAVQLAVPPCVR